MPDIRLPRLKDEINKKIIAMFNNKLQTRTKDYYTKRNELKRLVIEVRQKQEKLSIEQRKQWSETHK